MQVLIQLSIILSFWLLGEWVSYLVANFFFLPGAIWGMIFIFLALWTGLLKESHIDLVGDWLLKHIAFFFIPISVSIITMETLGQGLFIKLFIIGIISTILTMMASMGVTFLLTKHKEGSTANGKSHE